ncbi:hypothetical protein GCM10022402_41310 [Salinactinospora qingdaonensis]|uniref:Uncharacterized protein n=1 Tax=Salinactinospora qingdaonensis TaxID=702744 RepID=A0ABP7GB38_9ACTN
MRNPIARFRAWMLRFLPPPPGATLRLGDAPEQLHSSPHGRTVGAETGGKVSWRLPSGRRPSAAWSTPAEESHVPLQRPRRARRRETVPSYVRPYVLAHERRVREQEADERARRQERSRASLPALAGSGAL